MAVKVVTADELLVPVVREREAAADKKGMSRKQIAWLIAGCCLVGMAVLLGILLVLAVVVFDPLV